MSRVATSLRPMCRLSLIARIYFVIRWCFACRSIDFSGPHDGTRAMDPTAANTLLACLPEADLRALEPHLNSTKLQQGRILFDAGDTINHVFFPTGAVVSLVVALQSGETVEAAMVGRD